MKEVKKISVIVPVYNVREEYLRKCIESILNQSFKDFELILVDDGSTDNSLSICLEYSKIDKRIKVVKQENQGLSIARNTGIKIAQGEWIGFVDDDDYISDNCFLELIKNAEKNRVDYCTFNKILQENHNKKMKKKTMLDVQDLNVPIKDKENIKRSKYSNGVVWSSIYRKDIINQFNIEFVKDRRAAYEDVMFNMDYFNNCNSVCVIDGWGYYYRYNENSVSRGYNSKRMDNLEITTLYLLDKYKKNGINNSEEIISGMFWSAFRKILNSPIRYEKYSQKETLSNIKELINRESVKKYVRLNYKTRKDISLDKALQFLVITKKNKSYILFIEYL